MQSVIDKAKLRKKIKRERLLGLTVHSHIVDDTELKITVEKSEDQIIADEIQEWIDRWKADAIRRDNEDENEMIFGNPSA